MSEAAPLTNAAAQDALNALTPEARSTWESTGTWPEPAAVTTTAAEETDDDEPAVTTTADAPVTPTAATTTADTPPAPVKAVSKRQQHINELERKAQLAELKAAELATKIAALEARTPAAEPKAEPKPVAVVDPTDPEPTEADFDSYPEFVRASARWAYRQEKRAEKAEADKAAADQRQADIKTEFDAKVKTWGTRLDTFIAKHPDRGESLDAFLADVHAGTPIGDALMDSEVGAELADYLAANPTEAERIARLSPISAIRALGNLEATLSDSTHASARAQPAAKLVTSAPAPPTTLAARSASPADPVRAAVERGDFSTFADEVNRALAR